MNILKKTKFNLSLAKMEEEIKPQIILTIDNLSKNYSKLLKCQNEKIKLRFGFKRFLKVKRNKI